MKPFFILFFLLTIAQAQIKEIDSLIIAADSILLSENTSGLLEKGEFIYNKSKIINYNRGILYGSFFIATSNPYFNDDKNFVYHTFLAENMAREQKNYYILTAMLYVKGNIYKEAGLCNQASKYIKEGLNISNNIKEADRKYILKGSLLILKSNCAYLSGIEKRKFLKLNLQAMRELKKAGKSLKYDYNYTNVALAYIQLGKIDSAEYYLSKSINNHKSTYINGVSYLCLASIENEKKNTSLALTYNINALNKLKQDPEKNYYMISLSYKLFAELYYKLGKVDKAKENDFFYKEAERKYSETKENLKNSLLVQLIDKAEKEQLEKKEAINKRTIIIVSIIFISVLLLTVVFLFYKKEIKKSKLKSKLIENKKGKLSLLENKINDAFTEVLELAKNDDPGFIPRFKEVYPEFYQKLTTKYPDLTIGQLRFCCMLRLNFSTKEIAYYHHLTVKGVQTRKNRLRKQLNIPSDADLNKWMIELDQNIENP